MIALSSVPVLIVVNESENKRKIKHNDEVCCATSCNFVHLHRAGKFPIPFHTVVGFQITIFSWFHIQIRTESNGKGEELKKEIQEKILGASEQFINDAVLLKIEGPHCAYTYKWITKASESSVFGYLFWATFLVIISIFFLRHSPWIFSKKVSKIKKSMWAKSRIYTRLSLNSNDRTETSQWKSTIWKYSSQFFRSNSHQNDTMAWSICCTCLQTQRLHQKKFKAPW